MLSELFRFSSESILTEHIAMISTKGLYAARQSDDSFRFSACTLLVKNCNLLGRFPAFSLITAVQIFGHTMLTVIVKLHCFLLA